MKVCVIDDDERIRKMYLFKLQSMGYDTWSASDGITALKVTEEVRPDLILLDIKMPGLPGHEVLRRIRQQEWGADIKVIVLTNISKSEAPQEFRLLNISDYIVKVHYTPSQVLEIIEKVLNNK